MTSVPRTAYFVAEAPLFFSRGFHLYCRRASAEESESVTIRKLCFFEWIFTTQLTVYVLRQITSLMDTFGNDNEAF